MASEEQPRFLEYVFWYYLLARWEAPNATSTRQLLSEETTRFLLLLYRNGGRHGVFSPLFQAFGFRIKDTGEVLGLSKGERVPNANRLFRGEDPPRPFWRHTTNLLRHPKDPLSDWETRVTQFVLADQLPGDILTTTFELRGEQTTLGAFWVSVPTLDYRGAVYNTVRDGWVWLARTSDREDIPTLDEVARAKKMGVEEILRKVNAKAAKERAPREKATSGADSNSPAARVRANRRLLNEEAVVREKLGETTKRKVQTIEELENTPALAHDLLVLRIISALHHEDIPAVPGRLVQDIADNLAEETIADANERSRRTADALRRLEAEEWIKRERGSLGIRDAKWRMTGFLPVPWLDVTEYLIANKDKMPREYWQAVLLHLAEIAPYRESVDIGAIVDAVLATLDQSGPDFLALMKNFANSALLRRDPAKFLRAVDLLSDAALDQLLEDVIVAGRVRERFEDLATTAIANREYVPQMDRLTRAIDRVLLWRVDYPSVNAAFQAWLREASVSTDQKP